MARQSRGTTIRSDDAPTGILRRQSMRRVAVLETKRRRVLVRNGGSALGEIDDDLVTVAVGGSPGRAFRQIEFELDESEKPHADPVVIEKMLTAMKKAGAHIELEQKFAKALGIDANDRNLSTKIGRKSTLGDLVQATLRSEFERLLDFDVSLRRSPQNPSERAIHQARVATRRLRSDLKTFGPVLDPVWLRHTRSELRWIGTVLGTSATSMCWTRGSSRMTRLRVVLAVRRRCARGSPHSVGTRPRNWHMSCGVSATSTCSTDSTPARPCPGFMSARNPQGRESVKSDRVTTHEKPSLSFCGLTGGSCVEESGKLDRPPATRSSTRYGLPRSNSDTEPNWRSPSWARPPAEPPTAPKTFKRSSETITMP